jgi:hypothetical protein
MGNKEQDLSLLSFRKKKSVPKLFDRTRFNFYVTFSFLLQFVTIPHVHISYVPPIRFRSDNLLYLNIKDSLPGRN